MVRLAGIVFVLTLALVAAPLLVRACFGVYPMQLVLAAMVWLGLTVAGALVTLVLSFHALLRRRVALRAAIATSIALTLLASIAIYFVTVLIQLRYPSWSTLDASEPRTLLYGVSSSLADAFPLTAAWTGLFFFPAVLRAHAERTAALRQALAEAELLRLRSNLEPHFMLNTMNAISGILVDEPARARELLGHLGDLFRDANRTEEWRPIVEEIAWLRRYASIYELRFPDQLAMTWDVDPALDSREVPTLLIQPLVENALQHGALRVKRGEVHVKVESVGSAVRVTVEDNGPALGERRAGGQGIELVERRLALHYPAGDAALTFERHDDERGGRGGRTLARVTLPERPRT
jgi:hypothetical protein